VLSVVAASFAVRPECLRLRDRDGRLVGLFLAEPGQAGFALYQRHSVEKTPWVDRFRIEAGEPAAMVLYRTEYQSLGAGLPSGDEGGTVRLEDGWIVIDGMRRVFTRVVLGPSEIGEPRIMVGSRTWDLWRLAAGQGPLTLEAGRVPAARLAAWRRANAGRLARARAAPPEQAGNGAQR
jgi:hypothetical protein